MVGKNVQTGEKRSQDVIVDEPVCKQVMSMLSSFDHTHACAGVRSTTVVRYTAQARATAVALNLQPCLSTLTTYVSVHNIAR